MNETPGTVLDVLVVGGVGVDHTVRVKRLPLPVEDSLIVPPIVTYVGHTGSGVALGCRALGLRTMIVDVIGDDPEGELVLARFAEAGVQARTERHPSGTRRSVNLVTPDGERMSLYDPRHPFQLRPDPDLWREPMRRSRHVHVSIMNWGRHALRDAVTAGLSMSVDLHDWDGHNVYHQDFAYGADLVFLSATRLRQVSDARIGEVAQDILANGRASAVMVMDGSRGSRLVVRGRDVVHIEPVVLADRPPVDCNGAGDSYVAGFLYALLAGQSHRRAALAGSIAGSYACSAPGTNTALIDAHTLARWLAEPR